jgi:hypothetical protein
MKRLHLLAAAAATLILASGNASAQASATKNVDLNVNFSGKCQLATASAGSMAINFGTVQAFDPDVVIAPVTMTFECTRGTTTPTFKWDGAVANNVNGTGGGTPVTATTNGLLAGLRYQLTAAPGTETAGADPVLTAGSTDGGSPRLITVGIGGTLFQGAGAGANGVATATRVLTVAY